MENTRNELQLGRLKLTLGKLFNGKNSEVIEWNSDRAVESDN